MMIPAVGEQDAADIEEQGGDRDVFFQWVGGWEVC
jgi:hypothetical protein